MQMANVGADEDRTARPFQRVSDGRYSSLHDLIDELHVD